MKLLVPVDGSNASINAVKKALELSKKYNFSMKIISIVAEKNYEYRRNEGLWKLVDGSLISESVKLEKQLEIKAKENAERLLNAIANDEKEVQEKVKEAKAAKQRVKTLKNW